MILNRDIKEVKIIEVNVPKNDPNQGPQLVYLADGSLLGEIIPEPICEDGVYISIYNNEFISTSYNEIKEYVSNLNILIDEINHDGNKKDYQFDWEKNDIDAAVKVLQTYSKDVIWKICRNQHFVADKLLDVAIKFALAMDADDDSHPNGLLVSALISVMRNYHEFSGNIIKYGSEDMIESGSICAAYTFASLASIMRGEQLEFIDGKICLFEKVEFI